MTLGEKLRQARLQRGLSQSQTAGTQMTRNMLSQLEHDLASPSVKTLRYLADTLNVSVSWLLDETTDQDRLQMQDRVRACFRQGEYFGCIQTLSTMERPLNDEENLLLHRSALACAADLLDEEKFGEAEELLCMIGRCHSMYLNDQDRAAEAVLKLRWNLAQGLIDDALLGQIRCLLRLEAYERLAAEQDLLKGRLSAEAQQYSEALAFLRRAEERSILAGEELRSLYRLLELCYKELDNYKLAYHYASLRLEGE